MRYMSQNVRLCCAVLVMVSLVTMGISPACAFVSGKTDIIEICAADGSMKTVAVAQEDGGAVEPLPASEDHKSPHKKQECGFCFASSALKYQKASVVAVIPPVLTGMLVMGSGSMIQRSANQSVFEATGPPAVLL